MNEVPFTGGDLFAADLPESKFSFYCRYEFDVTKCMFSSGNITEKLRVAGFDCRGETVVDLFAGGKTLSMCVSFFTYCRLR